jgi:hypothetical protein
MLVVGLTIGFFALALGLLSVGVLLKKKTPLKGACHAAPAGRKAGPHGDERVCDTCSCGKVTP